MTIDVTSDMPSDPSDISRDASQLRVAPDSPLANLRKLREAGLETLYTDLRVPRWEDIANLSIFVRYSPVDPSAALRASQKRSKVKPRPDNWQLLATCDVLISCCQGIYAIEGDPDAEDPTRLSLRNGDPYGKWTKFDTDLAYTLGIEHTRATDIVLGLYYTPGDVLAAFAQLSEWSGLTAQTKADEAFLGN